MEDIYNYRDDFDVSNIIDRVNCIANELSEERAKAPEKRDMEKERQLLYAQFVQGLKLSTGQNKLF